MTDLCRRRKLTQAVYHAEAGAQNRNDGEILCKHRGNDLLQRRLDLHVLRFELLERFFELVDDEIFRRNIGCKRNHVELIARDARVGALAVLANGADELAHTVVLGNGLADGLVRDVDAVDVVHRCENVIAALKDIQVQAVVVGLHRNLHILEEKLRLVLAHRLE